MRLHLISAIKWLRTESQNEKIKMDTENRGIDRILTEIPYFVFVFENFSGRVGH